MAYNNANNPNAQYQQELEVPTFNKKEIQAIAIEGVKSAIEKGEIAAGYEILTFFIKDKREVSFDDSDCQVILTYDDINGNLRKLFNDKVYRSITFSADIGETIPTDHYIVKAECAISQVDFDGNTDITCTINTGEDGMLHKIYIGLTGDLIGIQLFFDDSSYANFKGVIQLLGDTDKISIIFKGI